MDNALFYTFSTIAQALAGAVALLGAVALFKLQNLDAQLREQARPLASAFPRHQTEPAQTIWDHFAYGRWAEFLHELPSNYPFAEDQMINLARLRVLVHVRDVLVKSLKRAVLLTFGTMVGAVGVLAFVPVLKGCPAVSWVVLGVGAIMFFACIGSYSKVMFALFE